MVTKIQNITVFFNHPTNAMEHLYFSDLVELTAGQVVTKAYNFPITECIIDSRSKATTPFPIFFAIVGINHDGHDYITASYEKGIRQFVVNYSHDASTLGSFHDSNILQVEDTLAALQQFASYWRLQHQLPVLAITGSNGKTMIKEWMYEFLSTAYTTITNPHSYNSQTGVPLAVSLISPAHTYAVFEAGISTAAEMTKLAQIIQPTDGLFINIGGAHSQGFSSLVEKVQEKAKLFTNCTSIYYCKDHTPIDEVLLAYYGEKKRLKTWSFHQNQTADYLVTYRPLHKEGKTALTMAKANQSYTFFAPFEEPHALENTIHCLVYLLDKGFDPTQLQATLSQLIYRSMQITHKEGIHNCQIIEDTYGNSLLNLKVTLDGIDQKNKKTVMLADLIAVPAYAAYATYAHLNRLLTTYKIDRFIGIGPMISRYADLFSMPETAFFDHAEDFIDQSLSFKDEVIVVKCAATFQKDRIIRSIEKNTHATILEIDLHAIRHNLSFFRKHINQGTKIMAMVKASAYGSSGNNFELIAALQRHGVDYLGVAYIDEGIYLRQKGITLPIMVMHPTGNYFDAVIKYKLEPEIYSLALLEALCQAAATSPLHTIPIHIKLETGMHRLGIEATDIAAMVALLQQTPNLQIVSIFSHLAASQDPKQDTFTQLQAEKLQQLTQYITDQLGINPLKHLLNTNGIIRFPQWQLDMVRLGIGLYGVGTPYKTDLIPAHTLKTTISQIKSIKKGESIGYDRKAIAKQAITIATIPIGYADGFSRNFGCGKGRVMIQGHSCPIIGHVCMDMTMVDVSGLPVKIGDEVIIFSKDYAIDELAKSIDTIAYELLTQISQRVKRTYVS
ncbi:MAG: bifunctional UDP-N-acetylmuramoyl-tripeptide:D-alanyl-D-alanine ligase/alanine racemase [Amoebophilaceae bacterium]|nr:bifunctional UDP-N-acetylmuramoyl-tripeptide:D-alanyl-D-alanine ligase/alanine racemase [Amoebophilaceae bacterium]